MKKLSALIAFAFCLPLAAQVNNPPSTQPVVAALDATAQSANIASTPLFTPSATGNYQVSIYIVVTQAATSSSSLPQGQISWTDPDTNGSISNQTISATSAANSAGTNSAGAGANTRVIHAKAGSAVSFQTTGYASSGATAMQFAAHVTVTRIN